MLSSDTMNYVIVVEVFEWTKVVPKLDWGCVVDFGGMSFLDFFRESGRIKRGEKSCRFGKYSSRGGRLG